MMTGLMDLQPEDLENDGCMQINCTACKGTGRFQEPEREVGCNECKTSGKLWANLF